MSLLSFIPLNAAADITPNPNPHGNIISLTGTAYNDTTFDNSGTLNNNSGGTLNNNIGGWLYNDGTLNNSGMLKNDATLKNNAMLNNNVGGTLNNSASGYLHNQLSGTLNNTSGWLNNDGTLHNDGMLNNNAVGVLNNSGTLNNNLRASLYNAGTLNNSAGGYLYNNYDSTLNNDGLLNNKSGGYLNNKYGGTLNNNAGNHLNNDGTLYNEGTLNNSAGGLLFNYGMLINDGTLNNSGDLISGGSIIGRGNYQQTSGKTIFDRTGSITQGSINIEGGSFDLDYGVVNLTSPSQFQNAGLLTGNGIINGNVKNAGTISPGHYHTDDPRYSTGKLTINGYYTQDTAGKLFADLGGLYDYDWLNIIYGAKLDGILEVTFDGNFVPAYDDKFTILTAAGGVTGRFTSIEYDGSLSSDWDVIYNTNSITLEYLGGGGNQTTPTPEPATMLLFGTGIAGFIAVRRKKTA